MFLNYSSHHPFPLAMLAEVDGSWSPTIAVVCRYRLDITENCIIVLLSAIWRAFEMKEEH